MFAWLLPFNLSSICDFWKKNSSDISNDKLNRVFYNLLCKFFIQFLNSTLFNKVVTSNWTPPPIIHKKIRNPGSKLYWQRILESIAWIPESKTVLDYLNYIGAKHYLLCSSFPRPKNYSMNLHLYSSTQSQFGKHGNQIKSSPNYPWKEKKKNIYIYIYDIMINSSKISIHRFIATTLFRVVKEWPHI